MRLLNLLLFTFIAIKTNASEITNQNFLNELNSNIGHRLNQAKAPTREAETGLEISEVFKQELSMVSISVHLNSDPMSVGDVLAAQFQYSSHLFDNKFINYFAYTGQHRFDAISSVNTDLSVDADEVNAQTTNLSALGIGVGFTTHFFKNVLGISSIEEKISSNFGYGFMNESVRNETYSGPGVVAELGINYRLTQNYHYGISFQWNHYGLSRDVRFDGEDISNRHLSATWAAIGLNWSVYF